jgi:hypothetical protein
MTSSTSRTFKCCIDRLLPDETVTPIALVQALPNPQTRAAALRKKLWEPGSRLRIRFLDGEIAIQKKVERFAQEWMQYANIKLLFGSDPNAEIRISFLQPGSWSLIGKDARSSKVAKHQPTMNYGWLTRATPNDEVRRVVLHEFGHALGLVHEHQNPATTIPWNKEAVYQFYQGPPNHWSQAQIDANLFQVYDKAITQFTQFDPQSIMLYPIPAELTVGGYSVGWNSDLSDLDKQFILERYPFVKPPLTRSD